MTLTSITERPLAQTQPSKNARNTLKSPNLPLPPSPPPAPGAGREEDKEEEEDRQGDRFQSYILGQPDPVVGLHLCASLTSPISPLSPLTPKYGSFISRDSSLTGINEFASSLGTSYIDSVLIDCYTGQQTPQILDSGDAVRALPPGDTQPLHGPPRAMAPGILKRPQSLAIQTDSSVAPSVATENGCRRTVTFSQQVCTEAGGFMDAWLQELWTRKKFSLGIPPLATEGGR